MNQTPQSARCGNCGDPIDEPTNLAPQDRKPCPSCGSTTRAISVSASDTVTTHASVRLKHEDATGETLGESTSGDDLHRKTGKWMQKSRTIDHKNDQYKEVIIDPVTGRIVHQCEEGLSQHRGHGSDRKRARNR